MKEVKCSSSSTIAKQQQMYIKCVSIHEYSQLSQLKDYFLYDKQPIILIARITPTILKNPEESMKLVNELYLAATKNNNYCVFRLGEERIIVLPNSVQVEEEEEEGFASSHQNQNALIYDYDDEDAQANNNNNNNNNNEK
jgi:SepF-like predicted cell division protein (DUF552 family)